MRSNNINMQYTLKVFASLVDGHLCIFTKDTDPKSQTDPIFNETLEDRLEFEKAKWIVQVSSMAFITF